MTLHPGDSCVNNWMLKAMAKDAGFLKHKRITNHSVRKFLVQKLRNANIPPTETMAITGHKNLSGPDDDQESYIQELGRAAELVLLGIEAESQYEVTPRDFISGTSSASVYIDVLQERSVIERFTWMTRVNYKWLPCDHAFQQNGTMFIIQDIIKTNVLTKKNASPPGDHVFQTTETIFELFHEDPTINVASTV
ncbi:hypothetical protein DPMN_102290 [Dreissena polymorpha]|uniref:Uncharacterized protein n=1 Tax=Dreissena polymorpha TaxID=45954 RepID=A0A9D4LIT6_DREPO|nr:hypothetical protein DPMN_102290 [Dreissena polymorpha]